MCVIGGSATQFVVTNSAFKDTGSIESSEKLKRVIAFLQFSCVPENANKIINELVAFLPNVKGVPPREELQPFAEILERDYTTTKWLYTFDLRFTEIMNRMLYLYLQGGISEDEFMTWMEKNVRSAASTVTRRKELDLSQFEPAWRQSAPLRAKMEGLPDAARP